MAEILKSALFVDFDSIHRSLQAAHRDGDVLAQRTSAWVVAIESGRLVTVRGGAPSRRRFALRRCYADPALLGKSRIAFVAAGFEVIDCPPLEHGNRNAASIAIALDAVEALAHPTAYEEFVLLSADADLSPILQRLHAQERMAVVYAGPQTPPAYVEAADGVVEEAKLLSLLFADEAPAAPRPPPVVPARTGRQAAAAEAAARAPAAPANPERAEIEALARKVHGATNVPLLPPRTFAELFGHLADEIRERGYHFQETAENVTAKLTGAGRNVTRRQVVFVVKGLALKGHVFSTTDTAEKLAEVFREQVLYLVGNAGLELAAQEAALLPAWIAGRAVAAAPQPAAPPAPPPVAEPEPQPVAEARGSRRRVRPPEAAPPPAAVQPPPPEARPVPPAPPPARPPEEARRPARPAQPRPGPAPKAPPAAQRPAAPPKAAPAPPPKAPPAKPAPPPARPAPRPAAAPPAAAAPKPAPKPAPAEASSEALESSILAAIAQAVDVLIEDSHAGPEGEAETAAETPAAPAPAAAAPESRPDPAPSEGGDSDDIGDEIQRIIASYSRARQQGDT